jgi:hypothetical protein
MLKNAKKKYSKKKQPNLCSFDLSNHTFSAKDRGFHRNYPYRYPWQNSKEMRAGERVIQNMP